MPLAHMARYNENRILSAPPGEVLVALYDGAIRFCRKAQLAIEQGDVRDKGLALGKALAIIGELSATLNDDAAPELCANLRSLYGYMTQRLTEASAALDVQMVSEVIGLLQQLRVSWAQAIAQAGRDNAAAGPVAP